MSSDALRLGYSQKIQRKPFYTRPSGLACCNHAAIQRLLNELLSPRACSELREENGSEVQVASACAQRNSPSQFATPEMLGQRLCPEEGLAVRLRRGRRHAVGGRQLRCVSCQTNVGAWTSCTTSFAVRAGLGSSSGASRRIIRW